jgi:uncharacterized protein with von Willebrand factor type A (vWA) domain
MTFIEGIGAFTEALRDQYGFGVGLAETRDALRAAELVGVDDGARMRSAFRAVYCATADEAARFDAAFDDFFFGAQGVAQPNLTSRHTRPGREPRRGPETPSRQPRASEQRPAPPEPDEGGGPVAERRPVDDRGDAAAAWQTLRARYSPAVGRTAEPPRISVDGLERMLAHASRLVARLRVARSRRRTPRRDGDRIDLRRTLRASVETAGDPIDLRRTARAMRSARFVVFIDGSRSTSEYAGPMLQFTHALVRRSRRASAFVFSTGLRDVTAALRERDRAGRSLDDLGDAWGGGTRIGDNLRTFLREHGARLLSRETLVFIFSDGLDVGNLDRLEGAMRELRGRCAGIVWLHPHAGAASFVPSARGMCVALRYISSLRAARVEQDFAALARDLERAAPRSSPGRSAELPA